LAKYLQETDRSVREKAWRATAERRLQDKDAIDDIFDQMIERRQKLAKNVGYSNYRDYQHDAMLRFDYRPEDCFAFHDGVEQHVMPLVRKLDARRRERLGVAPLRPWDLNVDELGRMPLRPFSSGQDLIDRSRKVFGSLDKELATMYQGLGDDVATPGGGANFDLDSRKGKAPGGYQYMRDRSGMPFIFMNGAGLHRDVETMVHEAGHAFHSLLCQAEPLRPYRDYPIEFAEVASMSMELLSMPHWSAYYPSEDDANRARRIQIEGSVSMLPWIATIDCFQQWIYTHEGHSRAERQAAWLEISRRFGHDVSWDGLNDEEAWQWQRQSHLFGNPFYYVEYGIAQLGALGLWLIALERGPAKAIELYKRALTLGGSKPLPALFAAADLPFDFGPNAIGRIVEAVEKELARLPE
ncbi:MAG: M3 family oligoendopeptidase, partial [Phycisphaerales bacterium]|nr:M3 family oligoendopeptidase [Phycisphaerales bacterium]